MIRARWRNGAFWPVMGGAPVDLSEGETVGLDYDRARSRNSHNHQFAEVHEAWINLPEWLAGEDWAGSTDAMRKRALIETGWRDVLQVVTNSPLETAPALLGMARKAHGYAMAVTDGEAVTLITPKSQSLKAMGKADFQQSKNDVLEWCAAKIGTDPFELKRAAL